MSAFPQQFRELLKSRGWTQVEAAARVGIHQSQVSNFLSGKSEPNLITALRIAAAFRISLDELAGERPGVVREASPAYLTPQQSVVEDAFRRVKIRWNRCPKERPKIELAIRALFAKDADAMIAWIQTGDQPKCAP